MSLFQEIVDDIIQDIKDKKFLKPFVEYCKDTKSKIIPIRFFRPDGKTERPDGVYVAKGMLWNAIHKNKNSFHRANLKEKISDNQWRLSDYKGGIIVFATSVNAVVDDMHLGKIQTKLKKVYYSMLNRIFRNKYLKNIIEKWNASLKPEDFDAWAIGNTTVGNFFTGKYYSNGQEYNDTSTCIEINDIPSEILLILATEICRQFKQREVLVKDFNTNKIFLCNADEIEGISSKDKIKNAAKDLENLKNINKKTK